MAQESSTPTDPNTPQTQAPPLAPVPVPTDQPLVGEHHELTDDVLAQIKHLADRVGGIDKLRDLVNTLAEVGRP